LAIAVIVGNFREAAAEGLTKNHRQLTIQNAEVLEDFESYSIGSRLQTPPWTLHNECTGSIVANDRGGKAFKGGSCYWGQHAERSYSFNLESNLKTINMIFSSRMNSVSGHTITEVRIGSSTQELGFGQYKYQPFITSKGMPLDLPASTSSASIVL